MKKRYLIPLFIVGFLLVSVTGSIAGSTVSFNYEPLLTQRIDALETRIMVLESQVQCLWQHAGEDVEAECDIDEIQRDTPAFESTPTITPEPTDTPVPTSTPHSTETPESENIVLSGTGTQAIPIVLTEGLWTVSVELENNELCFMGTCIDSNFAVSVASVSGGDDLIFNEIASELTFSSIMRVHDESNYDVVKGKSIVSVDAEGDWTLTFNKE